MNEAEIIIKCPKCFNKALFKSSWNTNRYVLHPAIEGKVICTNCGYNGSLKFSKEYYYYQIPIANRTLYARNLENLIAIRTFFEKNKTISELGLDFPKSFYENKEEIIKKVNTILEKEKGIS